MKKDRSLFKILFKTLSNIFSKSMLIFSIISIVSLVIVISVGIYAYNFIPIRTISLCVSDEIYELPIDIECSNDDECSEEIIDTFNNEDVRNELKKEIKNDELADMSLNMISNLIDKVSEDTIECIENKCIGRGIENFDNIISFDKAVCKSDEKSKEINVYAKDLISPSEIFKISKAVITSKDFRENIKGFIKTRI